MLLTRVWKTTMCRNPQEELGFHRPLYYTALGKYLRAFSVSEGRWKGGRRVERKDREPGRKGEGKRKTGRQRGRERENACGVCV